MIPPFPTFKKLELSDESEIRQITDQFPPYSDFNFLSMWSWNVKGETEISRKNTSLIVKFADYISNEPFFSFIGKDDIKSTLSEIFDFIEQNNQTNCLKLIPEVVKAQLGGVGEIEFIEDIDNFDYLYDIEKLTTYKGRDLRSKKNLSNRFKKAFLTKCSISVVDHSDGTKKDEVLRLVDAWKIDKQSNVNENEFIAIKRFLEVSHTQTFMTLAFVKERLVGFIMNEAPEGKYAILHFEKADYEYDGVHAFLMQENARILLDMGKTVLNYEQDLGLPGLRLSKKAFRPSHYLKKYTVLKNHQ